MSRYDRQRWRAAMLVREQLWRRQHFQLGQWVQAGTTPISAFDRYLRLQRQLQRAQRRHLTAAARRVRNQMIPLLRDLGPTLESVQRQLHPPLPTLPSMRELLAELEALAEEFPHLEFDRLRQRIEVHTPPIELEGVYLGPFAMQLELAELGQPGGSGAGLPLFVVALDPHPAAGDGHVTHPHVSDERLCAGDAHAAMQRTLSEGRLSEFFLLVRSVLTTYNRDSPYVSLDSWSGEPCDDCGCRVDEDDRGNCQQCDRTLCPDCLTRCPDCDEAICHGCMTRCDRCQEPVCDGCLSPCASCRQYVCVDCSEGEICSTCHREQMDEQAPEPQPQETDDETTNEEESPPARAGAAGDR